LVDMQFIRKEVEKLLAQGVIESSRSPWRAQVLVTKDERHKRRMVIVYSQTINRFTALNTYPLPRIDQQVNELAKCKWFSTLDLKSACYQVPLATEDRAYTSFEADGKLYQYCRLPFGVTNGVSCFQIIIDSVIADNDLKQTFAYLDNITIGGFDKADHDRHFKKFLDATSKINLTFNDAKSVVAVTEIDILGYRISQGSISPDPERLCPLIQLPIPKLSKQLKRCLGMFAYYAR